ncbi:hypothetical protein K438DRAFT_1787746 [Mycena galopus ATCC 62051]|nr:hypothetical protein K438DRAFT_1787746 [Mycena galopus ATCC 62051]
MDEKRDREVYVHIGLHIGEVRFSNSKVGCILKHGTTEENQVSTRLIRISLPPIFFFGKGADMYEGVTSANPGNLFTNGTHMPVSKKMPTESEVACSMDPRSGIEKMEASCPGTVFECEQAEAGGVLLLLATISDNQTPLESCDCVHHPSRHEKATTLQTSRSRLSAPCLARLIGKATC